jgi:tetratricopeptide (TPR) repeat protein
MSVTKIKQSRERNLGRKEARAEKGQATSGRKRWLADAKPYIIAGIAIAAITIACYTFWQQMRPGMTHFRQGMAYAAAGRADLAEQEWKEGIKQDPAFLSCYLALGHAYDLQKRCQDSAKVYELAAQEFPANGNLYLDLSHADLCAGDSDGVESAGRRAAELLPANAVAQGEYAEVESSLNHYSNALWAAQRAHNLDPANRTYLLELVRQEAWKGDLTQAKQDLSGYLAAHPDDGWANHTMALIDQRLPHTPALFNEAVQYEEHAHSLMPQDVRVSSTLGQLYLQAGRTKEALAIYQEGLKANPASAQMAKGLLACYSRLGDTQQADQAGVLVNQIDSRLSRMVFLHDELVGNPDNISAALELAQLYQKNEDYEGAYQVYAKLVRQMPLNSRARTALAGFWQKRHRPDLAAQALNPSFIPEADVVVQ